MTRTWVVGKPTPEQKKIATDLYTVHEKVLAFIKPGIKYFEVLDFVRKELTPLGYSPTLDRLPCQQFSLHGIGLGPFHDPPNHIHREIVLEPNMVLSFQPSVRHENYSIRFEDNFVITQSGIEMLTKIPKELI